MSRTKTIAGNLQWVEWLEKHAMTLDEVGNKSAQAFKKGSRNLRKCPITYTHPSEATAVEGIGPGIVKYLEKKLSEHCAYTGDDMPPSPEKKGRAVGTKKRLTKKQEAAEEEARLDELKEERRRRTMGIAAPTGTYYRAPVGSAPSPTFSDLEDEAGLSKKAKKAPAKKKSPVKKKPSGPKTYVPKLRSGAYAILLSLYQCASDTDPYRWTLKEEILEYATGLCDVPFDTPSGARGGSTEGGQGYSYSGWSSKKILLEKGLVVELSKRPKKFALTEEGFELAHKLASTADIPRHASRDEFDRPSYSSSSKAVRPPSSSNPHSDGRSNGKVKDDWGEGNVLGNGSGSRGGGGRALVNKVSRSAKPESEDEDELFNRQMEETLELSRRESSEAPAYRSNGRTLGQTSSVANIAKKAAQGFYAGQGPVEPPPKASLVVDEPFGYYYLDEVDHRVLRRDLAEVMLEEGTHNQIYRIEFREAQKNHSMTRSIVRTAILQRSTPESGGPTKVGYLRSRVANENCPGFTKDIVASKQSKTDAVLSLMAGYKAPPRVQAADMYAAPASVRRSGNDNHPSSGGSDVLPRSTSFREPSEFKEMIVSNGIKRTASAPINVRPPSLPSTSKRESSSSSSSFPTGKIVVATYDPPPNQIINRHPLDPVRDYVSTVKHTFPRIQEEVWKAGTFKVVLIVDTRELGTSKSNRTEIVDSLKDKGIRVDRQMLPLGDMLWVARKYDARGNPTGEDDLVLDHIIERKRLDDLVKSVQDGRYLAQKVRMKDSGISNRIYLIEKYDTTGLYTQYGQKIWTCKSQLQVNDGFFMHESSNVASTISFLATRTQVMIELYEKFDLLMIPDASIDRSNYLALQQHLRLTRPASTFLTSYKSFTNLNQSDSNLTLRIQWSAMIQSVAGLSAAKAEPFVERWPTPGIFFDDCRKRRLEVEVEDYKFDTGSAGNSLSPYSKGKAKSKRRKAEDFVVEELGLDDMRGIREKLGATLYQMFSMKGYGKD